MVTLNSTNNKFTAQMQVDYAIINSTNTYFGYKKSNSEVVIKPYTGVTLGIVDYKITQSMSYPQDYFVTYTSNTDGSLVFSMRKFMARCTVGDFFQLTIQADINGAIEQISIVIYVLDGVSYTDIIAPRDNGYNEFTQPQWAFHSVVPPNVILRRGEIEVIAESSLANIAQSDSLLPNATWYGYMLNEVALTLQGSRNNEIHLDAGYTKLIYIENAGGVNQKKKSVDLVQTDACENLVLLRWTSQTGATRQHFFHVAELDATVDETARLVSLHDGYKVAKNVSNGFKIHLDGLTPYSHWYYSDMIMASDLRAAFAPAWNNINIDFNEVLCTEVNKATPLGTRGGFLTFEATIKHKHYDSY